MLVVLIVWLDFTRTKCDRRREKAQSFSASNKTGPLPCRPIRQCNLTQSCGKDFRTTKTSSFSGPSVTRRYPRLYSYWHLTAKCIHQNAATLLFDWRDWHARTSTYNGIWGSRSSPQPQYLDEAIRCTIKLASRRYSRPWSTKRTRILVLIFRWYYHQIWSTSPPFQKCISLVHNPCCYWPKKPDQHTCLKEHPTRSDIEHVLCLVAVLTNQWYGRRCSECRDLTFASSTDENVGSPLWSDLPKSC